MKLQIEYKHTASQGTIVTLPADVIRWERQTKSKLSDLWTKEGDIRIGFEDLAVLVWSVLTRQNQTQEPFEVWVDGLEDIVDFGDVAVNPTQAEASTVSD